MDALDNYNESDTILLKNTIYLLCFICYASDKGRIYEKEQAFLFALESAKKQYQQMIERAE